MEFLALGATSQELKPVLELLVNGGLLAILFFVTLGTHLYTQKKRRNYLSEQESELSDIVVTDLKRIPAGLAVERMQIVTGSITIANNYFVAFCSGFRNIFGGEMHGYTQLGADARRLALIRLKQEARALKATHVFCLRYETMTVQSGAKKTSAGTEILAYGTALIPPKTALPSIPESE